MSAAKFAAPVTGSTRFAQSASICAATVSGSTLPSLPLAWTLWRTGRPDFLMLSSDAAVAAMTRAMGIGALVILMLAALVGWCLRRPA